MYKSSYINESINQFGHVHFRCFSWFLHLAHIFLFILYLYIFYMIPYISTPPHFCCKTKSHTTHNPPPQLCPTDPIPFRSVGPVVIHLTASGDLERLGKSFAWLGGFCAADGWDWWDGGMPVMGKDMPRNPSPF